MYTVIRKYNLIRGTKEELIQHVQESLVPLLNHVPGFRAYFLVDAGDNEVAIISTFDTLADAKAAARLTKEWVTENAETFIQGGSTIAAGQVKVQQYQKMIAKTQSNPFERQANWV
jgi:heme-degrading monooxygenase HmoA